MPWEGEGKDRGDVSTIQKMPKTVSKPPEAGSQAWNSFSLKALAKEPTVPGDT